MKTVVTVREHARLTTDRLAESTLDRAQVSASAFDWLCDVSAKLGRGGANLVEVQGRRWLRLDNYVGILETPCGTQLEILPKHADVDSASGSRKVLQRMIATALDLPARESTEASIALFDMPLTEWVMAQFVAALDRVVHRGIRSDYLRVESSEPFLRGQLNLVRQMRKAPGRDHIFELRHDVFSPDRAENRLAVLALDAVRRSTVHAQTWRLSQELGSYLSLVPPSVDVKADFRRWSSDRLMAHYRPLRPWCELILGSHVPHAMAGEWRGISMLFPMERLFERTVIAALRRHSHPAARLTPQAASKWLCQHESEGMFRLQPDLLLEHGGRAWVLDAKWKMLDAGERSQNYGIAQSDMYQLFAYAQRYLDGVGELVLVYPGHAKFSEPLPPFSFSPDAKLVVLPFDLDGDCLMCHDSTSLPMRSRTEARRELH